MDRVLSFDPAVHHVAWAAFDSGKLTRCGFEHESKAASLGALLERRFRDIPARVVIELPQVYRRRGRTDPNDLVMVSTTVGRIAQAFGADAKPPQLVWPHDWKGTVPKPIMLKRIVSHLDDDEARVLHTAKVTGSLRHNVIDAIGVGLWSIGRLGK